MGIPFSSEVQTIAADAASFKSHATTVLYALVIITILHTFLLAVALLGLLITVNPDLKEERKAYVTPAVNLMLKFAGMCMLLVSRGWKIFDDVLRGLKMRIRRMGRQLETHGGASENVRVQRRRVRAE